MNSAAKTAAAYNAARQIARTSGMQGSDDSDLFTLDFVGGEFVIMWHSYRDGSEVFARCASRAELAAARLRMPHPNEEGEGSGHVVAITVAADVAMRKR